MRTFQNLFLIQLLAIDLPTLPLSKMKGFTFILGAVLLVASSVYSQHDPHFVGDRTTLVHLFEWRWDDIAQECERFLGPYGYGGVQVSPANENVMINQDVVKRPWYERYQPVSYKLESRSGTEQQFQDMVRRCNAVGVRIIVDIVLNHMTNRDTGSGTGTGGSRYDSIGLSYDGVPYTAQDFHGSQDCPTKDGEIADYADLTQLRNCRLLGLNDINQRRENVRERMVEFLNRMISYGVAGFRVDAAKLMWPEDLKNMFGRLNNLPTEHGFAPNSKPFVVQEIIVLGGDEDDMIPYFEFGRITEFKVGVYFGDLFRKWNGQALRFLRSWGPEWNFIADNNALVFVDNHDNQRGHGAGGEGILTFFDSRLYKMATAFNLAWPYGLTRVMSSYLWDGVDSSSWVGPPHDANYNTSPVVINPDLTCATGWICEHRWRQIYNMVKFRNVCKGQAVTNWYDGQEAAPNQIAFSRGNRGFLAINNDQQAFQAQVTTDMADGTYCDVITADVVDGRCTGRLITVSGGKVNVDIPGGYPEDSMIAIHAESKV